MVCVHVLKRADEAAGPSSVYFAAAGLANGLFCVIINNTAAAQKTDQAPPESGRVFHTVLPAVGRKPPSMKRKDSFHRAHALHPRTHRARRILQ